MNILISADERAKVNDFGLARIRPKANTMIHTECGTPNWQAPEFWPPESSYTEKVDVYACGLIFWEILTWAEFNYPFHGLEEKALMVEVKIHRRRPPIGKLSMIYPPPLSVLIMNMWNHNPDIRPSMNQVVDSLSKYLC